MNPYTKNKYGAKPTEYNGRRYHSKAEATRAAELDILLKQGAIAYWTPQPVFFLAGVKYVADFLITADGGAIWVEDVKGVETAKFRTVKTLWQSSGPGLRLRVLTLKGKRWQHYEV